MLFTNYNHDILLIIFCFDNIGTIFKLLGHNIIIKTNKYFQQAS